MHTYLSPNLANAFPSILVHHTHLICMRVLPSFTYPNVQTYASPTSLSVCVSSFIPVCIFQSVYRTIHISNHPCLYPYVSACTDNCICMLPHSYFDKSCTVCMYVYLSKLLPTKVCEPTVWCYSRVPYTLRTSTQIQVNMNSHRDLYHKHLNKYMKHIYAHMHNNTHSHLHTLRTLHTNLCIYMCVHVKFLVLIHLLPCSPSCSLREREIKSEKEYSRVPYTLGHTYVNIH